MIEDANLSGDSRDVIVSVFAVADPYGMCGHFIISEGLVLAEVNTFQCYFETDWFIEFVVETMAAHDEFAVL